MYLSFPTKILRPPPITELPPLKSKFSDLPNIFFSEVFDSAPSIWRGWGVHTMCFGQVPTQNKWTDTPDKRPSQTQ